MSQRKEERRENRRPNGHGHHHGPPMEKAKDFWGTIRKLVGYIGV